jgi:beta-glucanase (GH16 family)
MKKIYLQLILIAISTISSFAYAPSSWHSEVLNYNVPNFVNTSKFTFGVVNNTPYLFFIGSDYHIYALINKNNKWEDAVRLSPNTPAAKTSSKLSFVIIENKPHIFYSGTDNFVHDIFYDPTIYTSGWSPGSTIGDMPLLRADSPIEYGIINGKQSLFYISASDNKIHSKSWNYGWSPDELIGDMPVVRAGSPVRYGVINGKASIYYFANDNKIHHKWWGYNGGWSLGVLIGDMPEARTDSPLEYGFVDGIQRLFFIASYDNKIHDKWWGYNSDWSPGWAIGDMPEVISGSALAVGKVDDLDCVFFIAASDSKIHDKSATGGSWSQGLVSTEDGSQVGTNREIKFGTIGNDEYVFYVSNCGNIVANWKQAINLPVKTAFNIKAGASYEFDIETSLNTADWKMQEDYGWTSAPFDASPNMGFAKYLFYGSNGEAIQPETKDLSNHEIDHVNGNINLVVKKESSGYWGRITKYDPFTIYPYNYQYTTAQIISTIKYKYGYFEIRSKMPSNLGSSDGANFWLYGNTGHYNELDIFEFQSNLPSSCPTNFHWGNAGDPQSEPENFRSKGEYITSSTCMNNLKNSFHTYGIDWQPDKITWYMDNKPIRTLTTLLYNSNMVDIASEIYAPMAIIADVAYRFGANNLTGYPANFIDKFNIDYIRVYDKLLPITELAQTNNLKNNWDINGTDGADYAIYFYLPAASSVNVSTNHAETNFDTKIEIFKNDNTTTGYYNDNLNGNTTKSTIAGAQLAAGYYYVVVDGNNGSVGQFKLTVDKDPTFSEQINYTSLPEDLQFFPRDVSNNATISIAGKSFYSSYNQLRTKIIDNSTNAVLEDKLTVISFNNSFTISHQIQAALKQYNLEIYAKNGATEILIKKVENLVCGDLFIISGQSNALASSDGTTEAIAQNTLYSSPYCRSLGTHYDKAINRETTEGVLLSQDLKWSRPSCIWWDNGFVGTWAIKLQYELSQETGIPNCFINGSKTSALITSLMASSTPSSPGEINSSDNVYDRLYKKLYKYGLTNSVKGVFWYQGEADAALSTCDASDYGNRFNLIYNSWKVDYPGVQKIFLFQINTGCGGSNTIQIREIQRQLSSKFSNIEIMSTIGSVTADRSADNCHYTISGYNILASKIKPFVKKAFYGSTISPNTYPSKIVKAYFTSSTQLCLEFDKSVVLQTSITISGNTVYLKDYFYGENSTLLSVQSISSTNNKIYLNLTSSSFIPKLITYGLKDFYSFSPQTVYTGPWVMSSTDVNTPGALAFKDFPISSSISSRWVKAWSDNSVGNIVGDLIYTGDFDGGSDEELLSVQSTGGSSDVMNLFKYINNDWTLIWSNYGNSSIGEGIYAYRAQLITGDYDGDGKDELLGNSSWTTLFKYSNGDWHWTWSDMGSSLHYIYPYKDKLYAGDFNGDGKDELLGCDLPNGANSEIIWNGSNFIAGSWSDLSNSNSIRDYKSNMITGDFDGDGKTELLGFSSWATVFHFDNGNWIWGYSTYGASNLGGWTYPISSTDRVLAGNIDSELKDELFFIGTSPASQWATSMDLKTDQSNWNWNWSVNPNPGNSPFIDDWSLSATGSPVTRYYFVKPKASEPKYLLAIRSQSCGYISNMYKVSNILDNYRGADQLYTGNDSLYAETINAISIFPNPANNELYIKNNDEYSIDNHLSIYNFEGLLVYDKIIGHSEKLDISDLKSGVYIVRVIGKNTTCVKQLIINK